MEAAIGGRTGRELAWKFDFLLQNLSRLRSIFHAERNIVSHPSPFLSHHPNPPTVELSFSQPEEIPRRSDETVRSRDRNRFVYISRNRFAFASEYFSRIPEHFTSQPPIPLVYFASPPGKMQNIRDAIGVPAGKMNGILHRA